MRQLSDWILQFRCEMWILHFLQIDSRSANDALFTVTNGWLTVHGHHKYIRVVCCSLRFLFRCCCSVKVDLHIFITFCLSLCVVSFCCCFSSLLCPLEFSYVSIEARRKDWLFIFCVGSRSKLWSFWRVVMFALFVCLFYYLLCKLSNKCLLM